MQSRFIVLLVLIPLCSVPKLFAETEEPLLTLHAQSTIVMEGHPAFHSPYSGPHSLGSSTDGATSFTATGSGILRLWTDAELRADPEVSAGGGFLSGPGVAGYPNDEVAHVGTRAARGYMARLWIQQKATVIAPMTLTLGRMSALDIFDGNLYSHDGRSQFMNWGLVSNAAWDYPADSRGYTWGATYEIEPDSWSFRIGSFLEPAEANGSRIETRLSQAHSETTEIERRYAWRDQPGALRALAYWSHADMGNYRAALGINPFSPDVTVTRVAGNAKWGLGLNWEQAITKALGVFSRIGWNDGHTETWAFTEVDQTASLGIQMKGLAWGRADDVVGCAALVNGLSSDHRDYLEAGGSGFVLGDGRLNYGTEDISEVYYAYHVLSFAVLTIDFQEIVHPGYNEDRGPASIGSLRLHVEI